MGFLQDLRDRILIHDGSKGYVLQMMGLEPGHSPEEWNLTHPGQVMKMHREYVEAGCDVIQTNTFTGNRIQLSKHGLKEKTKEINRKAAMLARKAAGERVYVAGSVGPTGMLFEPMGEMSFDWACDIFKEQVEALEDGGVDLINFETFMDISEMRAAIIAAREVTNLPLVCSMAFEKNARTLMGNTAFGAGLCMKALGADLVGANCSFGPEYMAPVMEELERTGSYLSLKPNAGLPENIGGVTVYRQGPEDFASSLQQSLRYNVRLVGGCCGTTPAFIHSIRQAAAAGVMRPAAAIGPHITSATRVLSVDKAFNIGTIVLEKGKSIQDMLDEAYEMEGYDAIEIIHRGQDACNLAEAVHVVMHVVRQPLILSCHDREMLSSSLRIYNGIAGIRMNTCPDYGAVLLL
ncbi:MAG: homocysteine S-methyltransferase family protein [Clostridia bacterium]